jgi:spore coat polysaccharide biosynthesis protein SpsF
MHHRVGVLLFARMSSSRLPGKMLRRIGPTSLLESVVARARLLELPIVLATSVDPSDDVLASAGASLGLEVHRGSLDDVLDRACGAARAAGFDAFARLCGDRPFLPLDDMRSGIALMRESLRHGPALDLVTTALPRPVPSGLLTEVIRTEALERVRAGAASPLEREHLTQGFYLDRAAYAIHELASPLQGLVGANLSVDTEADLRRLDALIGRHADVACSELVAALASSGVDLLPKS